MTVVGPLAARIGADPIGQALRGLRNRVLALEGAVGRFQIAPEPVQVDGVGHHGVVDQHEAHALAMLEHDGLGVGELHAVDRPHVAFHVAGQVQFDFAGGRRVVRGLDHGAQVGVGQHAPAVVAQADAGIVQPGRHHVGQHGIAHAAFGGVGVLDLHHAARAGGVAMVHAGHRRVVHARHRAVIHARGGRRAGLAHARHRAMIHAGHAAAHVMGHAHVHHGQQLDRVQRRHVGLHAGARCQRGARVAGAVHGLRKMVGAVLGRFDDHVVGLGHGDAELVDLHRRTSWPSAATTVIFRPGIRTSK